MKSIFHAKRTIEIKKKKKNSILGWECFAQRPLGQRISIVDMKSNLCYPLIDALRIKTARDHLVLYSFYRDISMASLHFSPEQFPQRHRITFIELIARYIYIYSLSPIIPNAYRNLQLRKFRISNLNPSFYLLFLNVSIKHAKFASRQLAKGHEPGIGETER